MEFIVTQEMIDLVVKVVPAVFVPVFGAAIGVLRYQWAKTKRATSDRITDLKATHERELANLTDDHEREVSYLERRLRDHDTDMARQEARLSECEANLRRCEERWRRPDSFLV